jgi:hypothetical protein
MPGVGLAELAATGTVPHEVEPPLLVVTPTAITLDGVPVVALQDGAVDASEREGGALGMKIPRLTAALATSAAIAAASAARDGTPAEVRSLDVALDPSLTYGLLTQVLFSAKQKEAGHTQFNLLARSGQKLVAIPLTLPDRTAVSAARSADSASPDNSVTIRDLRQQPGADRSARAPDPEDEPLRLVVSVTETEILLWSLSGHEGTLQAPKLRIARPSATAVAELGQALAEIAKRRWDGRNRPETSHDILFMADSTITIQAVLELLGAMRATPDGTVLFRDILLSAGFE